MRKITISFFALSLLLLVLPSCDKDKGEDAPTPEQTFIAEVPVELPGGSSLKATLIGGTSKGDPSAISWFRPISSSTSRILPMKVWTPNDGVTKVMAGTFEINPETKKSGLLKFQYGKKTNELAGPAYKSFPTNSVRFFAYSGYDSLIKNGAYILDEGAGFQFYSDLSNCFFRFSVVPAQKDIATATGLWKLSNYGGAYVSSEEIDMTKPDYQLPFLMDLNQGPVSKERFIFSDYLVGQQSKKMVNFNLFGNLLFFTVTNNSAVDNYDATLAGREPVITIESNRLNFPPTEFIVELKNYQQGFLTVSSSPAYRIRTNKITYTLKNLKFSKIGEQKTFAVWFRPQTIYGALNDTSPFSMTIKWDAHYNGNSRPLTMNISKSAPSTSTSTPFPKRDGMFFKMEQMLNISHTFSYSEFSVVNVDVPPFE